MKQGGACLLCILGLARLLSCLSEEFRQGLPFAVGVGACDPAGHTQSSPTFLVKGYAWELGPGGVGPSLAG